MSYINFQKVEIKNFLSVGNVPIIIDFKKGLNVIYGVNKDKSGRSNGTGKSSIIDAIYFSLFDKTPRDVKKAELVNKKIKKNTLVTLDFSIDEDVYKIIRGVKPNKCELWKNGKNISRDSIKNTNEEISKLLGVSEDVIKNCIILSINDTVPFMSQSKIEKRKFIEGIFDLNIFSQMLKEVRSDFNITQKDFISIESSLLEKNKTLSVFEKQNVEFENEKTNEIEVKQRQIDDKQTDISVLKKQLIITDINLKSKIEEGIKTTLSKIENNKSIKEKINKEKIRLEQTIDFTKQNIRNEESLKDGCPTCLREMTNEDFDNIKEYNKKIEEDVINLQDVILNLSKKINEIQQKENEFINIETKLQSKLTSIDQADYFNEKIQLQVDSIKNTLSILNADLVTIKSKENKIISTIQKYEQDIKDLTVEINSIKENLEVLDKCKFLFGEEGIKTFIITKMLDILNAKINFYLEKMNANCSLQFDEYFEEQIVNDRKQECVYSLFSSGEKRNIDIAIMFAFMDIQKLQGNFDTNLSLYDELIDSCLDEEGVSYVLDILKEKVNMEDKSIYLITHRKEAEHYVEGEKIELVKENGITIRK